MIADYRVVPDDGCIQKVSRFLSPHGAFDGAAVAFARYRIGLMHGADTCFFPLIHRRFAFLLWKLAC